MRISDWSSDVCSSDLAEHADLAAVDEPGAACCYARSDKHWIEDPQGIAWETFHTLGDIPMRSEEHTSELQSLMRISYAVFCLKKKNNRSKLTHELPTQHKLEKNITLKLLQRFTFMHSRQNIPYHTL